MSQINFQVRKSDGSLEPFKIEKLIMSLARSGADPKEAEKIANEVVSVVENGVATKRIYSIAHGILKRYNQGSYMRYSLKKAILRLGPSGYTFEKYFADILREYGYETQNNVVMKGRCIKHEIDVLAHKDDTAVTVECKYHSTAGRASDAKVALYIHSRFKDLEDEAKKYFNVSKYEGWLVTNTRFTIDAVNYARCMGFKILGWRYPLDGGLEYMIEKKRLYPVTMISGIKANLANKLISKGFILVRDIISIDKKKLKDMFGLSNIQAGKLRRYAVELCDGKIEH